ncbi:MAG: hypothetical protein WC749_05755 [Dehalococcoidia bacterium]
MTLKVKTVERTGEGSDVSLRALLNGELSVADFFFIQALKGNMYYIGSVDVTTATTWTATATVDITKPALYVGVPSDKVMIPVHIELYMEAFGTNAQFEVQAVSGKGGSYASGMTAITPVNMRTDLGDSSGLTCYAGGNTAVTVGQTSKINVFWRDGQQFAITKSTASATASVSDPNKFVWDAVATNTFVMCGPEAQLQINQGSQAGTGFVKLIALVLPSSELP